jgi:hypothetical protein
MVTGEPREDRQKNDGRTFLGFSGAGDAGWPQAILARLMLSFALEFTRRGLAAGLGPPAQQASNTRRKRASRRRGAQA